MTKVKYPISREYFPYTLLTPPYICPSFAKLCGDLMRPPRDAWRDEAVSVRRERLTGYDGGAFNVYIIEPNGYDGVLPCLVYCHGGAFSYSASPSHYRNAMRYAREIPARVVFLDYRRSPKYKYPTPLEDCFTAYRWAMEECDKLAVDPDRMAVAGDSAGGALAACLGRLVGERVAKTPVFQMLIYPVLDARCSTQSMKKYTDTPMWNARLNRKMWRGYLGDGCTLSVMREASPSLWKDFTRLADAYIETAEFDCLRDEAIEYAERLSLAGKEVYIKNTVGTLHGFDAKISAPGSLAAMDARIKYMRSKFYPER
jgi:acetyl esterase/lipase